MNKTLKLRLLKKRKELNNIPKILTKPEMKSRRLNKK
jgi:hypothetical protein